MANLICSVSRDMVGHERGQKKFHCELNYNFPEYSLINAAAFRRRSFRIKIAFNQKTSKTSEIEKKKKGVTGQE